MAISSMKLTGIAITVALGMSLSTYSTTASAAKKGPRASVDSQTSCSLDGTNLNVTIKVTDKTSGDAIAVVDSYSITPVYKSLSAKGNTTTAIAGLGDGSDTNTEVGAGLTISHSYPLCDSLMSLPTDLRAISAEASVSYGKDDGAGGVADVRTIINSCSDDPTTEAVEPAGIKINYDELATACAAP